MATLSHILKRLARLAAISLLVVIPVPLLGGEPDQQQNLAAANTAFAFKLLNQLAKESPGRNLFISPYSVSTVLQMVLNGAKGQTLDEMNQVLGTADLSSATRNASVRDLFRSLNNRGTNVILTTANALWLALGIPVDPAFNTCNSQYFGATISTLDFSTSRSVEVINAWASEKTRGKISTLISEPLRPADVLFLANAVYFKGNWLDEFNKGATEEGVFHLGAGRETRVSMMHKRKRDFVYRRGTGYQAVRLPYKERRLGMYVFLPDPGSTPDALLKTVTQERWIKVTRPGFTSHEGFLALPRFSLRCQAQLSAALNALGMRTAFQSTANFSGIASVPLWISEVLQQAFVEVNEEGTEAAAVTGVGLTGGIAAGPMPFEMIVDRPFFFLIHDGLTDSILFMGLVYEPGPA